MKIKLKLNCTILYCTRTPTIFYTAPTCFGTVPSWCVLSWIHMDQGRIHFAHKQWLRHIRVQFLTILKTHHIITVVPTLYYIYVILTKPHKILHYWYHNIHMLTAAYFIVVFFKEVFLSAPPPKYVWAM
jgi:hypothetical protein